MRTANVQSQVIPRVSVEFEDPFRSCICNTTLQSCIDDAPKLQKKRAKITDTDNEEEEEGKEPQADGEPVAEKEQNKAVDSSDDENTPISNEPE